MPMNAHDAYLESRILAADPVELIRILYRIVIDRVREAREHLVGGDILARSRALTQAGDAIAELACSLNYEDGGQMSRRLAALYEYMQWRLVDANLEQNEAPLVEVLGLLATLLEAWQQVKAPPAAPGADSTTADLLQLAAHTSALAEQGAEYASESWRG